MSVTWIKSSALSTPLTQWPRVSCGTIRGSYYPQIEYLNRLSRALIPSHLSLSSSVEELALLLLWEAIVSRCPFPRIQNCLHGNMYSGYSSSLPEVTSCIHTVQLEDQQVQVILLHRIKQIAVKTFSWHIIYNEMVHHV